MFQLEVDKKGKVYLKYVKRMRYPGERGQWEEIGHFKDAGIKELVALNRAAGLQVEIDEHGVYRALVLVD